jgi:hypothetical protein
MLSEITGVAAINRANTQRELEAKNKVITDIQGKAQAELNNLKDEINARIADLHNFTDRHVLAPVTAMLFGFNPNDVEQSIFDVAIRELTPRFKKELTPVTTPPEERH